MGAPSLPHQVQCCPGQDLKELVRSPLPSRPLEALALRAARWQAPTHTPHGRQSGSARRVPALSLSLWAAAHALLSSCPHPRGSTMSVPT